MKRNLDLDVAEPDMVAAILRAAADAYNESAAELETAWQDRQAGKPWAKIARILERAAAQVEKVDMP